MTQRPTTPASADTPPDALRVYCPRCHAEPGKPCLAVTRPHRARYEAARATPTIEARAEGGEGEVDYVERLLVLLDALRAADRKDVPGLLLAAAEDDAFIAALRPRPAAPAVADVALLTKVRESIVLAIAFLGRDHGTGRAEQTVPQVIAELALADSAILAALAQQPASVDPSEVDRYLNRSLQSGVPLPPEIVDAVQSCINVDDADEPASVDLDATARELLADAMAWDDRDGCLAWIEATLAGRLNKPGCRVDVRAALAAIKRALQHPRPTGEREKAMREAAAVVEFDPTLNFSRDLRQLTVLAILAKIDQPEGGPDGQE